MGTSQLFYPQLSCIFTTVEKHPIGLHTCRWKCWNNFVSPIRGHWIFRLIEIPGLSTPWREACFALYPLVENITPWHAEWTIFTPNFFSADVFLVWWLNLFCKHGRNSITHRHINHIFNKFAAILSLLTYLTSWIVATTVSFRWINHNYCYMSVQYFNLSCSGLSSKIAGETIDENFNWGFMSEICQV